MNLMKNLGFNDFFQESFKAFDQNQFTVGRVALEHKHLYRIWTEYGELLADVSGKMRFGAIGREDFPAVGDWVVISARPQEQKATIHAVLPRSSKFSRKVAGNDIEEQIVAANVDTIFLVMALNQDFNVRRLERYLVLAWESGANPVIVLSKSDLCTDIDEKKSEVESVAIGVPIVVISAQIGLGMEDLDTYLNPGSTVALLGSSGVGKSTIANYLMGKEVLKTKEIREGDDKGKHTTTHREMVHLPSGALLIDTPGMRELQLWEASDGMTGTFEDVESLAKDCQFTDCQHKAEPNCAVMNSIKLGTLSRERFDSYKKLQRELAYLASKEDKRLASAQKDKWKNINKQMKQAKKVR